MPLTDDKLTHLMCEMTEALESIKLEERVSVDGHVLMSICNQLIALNDARDKNHPSACHFIKKALKHFEDAFKLLHFEAKNIKTQAPENRN